APAATPHARDAASPRRGRGGVPMKREPRDHLSWEGGTVSAAWHGEGGDTLLALTHGAGGTYETPALVTYAEAMAARGTQVVRFNLPYVEAGKKTPGPQARDE